MAFLITKDVLAEDSDLFDSSVGVAGPAGITDETLARLKAGEGQPFRMLDDDRILYFEGLFIDDSEAEGYDSEDEFQPLDCFGTPDSGATIIQYIDPVKSDWEDL